MDYISIAILFGERSSQTRSSFRAWISFRSASPPKRQACASGPNLFNDRRITPSARRDAVQRGSRFLATPISARYTSNDAPRPAATRHYVALQRDGRVRLACVYMRGQGAWPASAARYVTFTRSCSLSRSLAPSLRSRAPLLSLVARSLRALLSSTAVARSTIVGVAVSARRPSVPLSSPRPPRSNLNYHFTLPFERAAAAGNCGNAGRRLVGLPFIRSFFTLPLFFLFLYLLLSPSNGKRS